MSRHRDCAHLHDQVLVAQHVGKFVVDRFGRFENRQVEIDPDPLRAVPFVPVDADQAFDDQVSDEDLPGGAFQLRSFKRLDRHACAFP